MQNRQEQLHAQFRQHGGTAHTLAGISVLETAQLVMRQLLEYLTTDAGFPCLTEARDEVRRSIDYIVQRRAETPGYVPQDDEQIQMLEEALRTF